MALLTKNLTTQVVYGEFDNRKLQICIDYSKNLNGFRPGSFPVILIQCALMFIISRSINLILKPLKQPRIIGDFIAGMVLGRSGLARYQVYDKFLLDSRQMVLTNFLSMICVSYFIFINFIKMDKSRILPVIKKYVHVGLTCFIVPLIFVLLVYQTTHKRFKGIDRIGFLMFTSVRISLSYSPSIINAVSELDLLTTELGEIVISCSILHEFTAWCYTGVYLVVMSDSRVWFTIIGCLIVLILFLIYICRPIVLWIIEQTPEGKQMDGFYVKGIIASPMFFGLITDMIGVSVFLGPMLVGLIIPSGPPLSSSIIEKTELILTEIVYPYIHIMAGVLLDINSVKDWKMFFIIQVILFSTFLGKIIGCVLAMAKSGGGIRESVVLASILNVKGVVDIALIVSLHFMKLIDTASFAALLLGDMMITSIAIPMVKVLYKPPTRLKVSQANILKRTLQLTFAQGEFRVLCCIHCEENIHGMISILKACNPTLEAPMCVYAIHLIDLVGQSLPLLQSYNSQTKRSKVNSTDRIMKALTKSITNSASTVQSFTLIAPFNYIHESICDLTQKKYIPFILLPYPHDLETKERKRSLHNFNINVQQYKPCTVGILVDRCLPRIFTSDNLIMSVEIIFFGGSDDREALALGMRMSSHPGVSTTLLKINRKISQVDYNDKMVDDQILRQYYNITKENKRVVYKEKIIETTMEAIDIIRSENNYNLIIVGKRKDSILEREMSPWIENFELRVIGDLIAAPNFYDDLVSILVIQSIEEEDILESTNVFSSGRNHDVNLSITI